MMLPRTCKVTLFWSFFYLLEKISFINELLLGLLYLYTVYLQLVAWSCTLVWPPSDGGRERLWSDQGGAPVSRRPDQVSHLLACFFLGLFRFCFPRMGLILCHASPIASRIFVLWAGLFRFSARP